MTAHPEPPAAKPAGHRPVRWGRSLLVAAVLAVAVSVLTWQWATSEEAPPYAQGANNYVIRMSDYDFSPEHMQWRVGERVTLTIINDTQAHPGRRHEFMMGRDPVRERTAFGTRFPGGFEQDFFEGVSVEISHSDGVSMVMPSGSELTGPDAGRDFVMEDMAMDGMDMGDGESDEMDMGDEHAEDEHAEDGEEHAEEGMADMGGHGDHGFMVELEPVGTSTISFVVPDKPGEWQLGCFAETGQHYANGMLGTVTIVE